MSLNINASARERIEAFFREAANLVGIYDPQAVKLFLDINPFSLSHATIAKLQDDSAHSSHERTINGAGFKMFSEVDGDGNVWIRMGGDQAKDCVGAYLVLTMLLKKHDLLVESRFDGSYEPLTAQWIYTNLFKIEGWAWDWMRQHPELLPESLR